MDKIIPSERTIPFRKQCIHGAFLIQIQKINLYIKIQSKNIQAYSIILKIAVYVHIISCFWVYLFELQEKFPVFSNNWVQNGNVPIWKIYLKAFY